MHKVHKSLQSLTDVQKRIHFVSTPEQKIASSFYRDYSKLCWDNIETKELECSGDANSLVFTTSNQHNLLLSSYMEVTIPEVRIKKKWLGRVRICWPRNLLYCMVVSASFKDKTRVYNSWDDKWMDDAAEWLSDGVEGFRESRDLDMGNIPVLLDWNEVFLPEHAATADQPWFYSYDLSTAFPLYYYQSDSQPYHTYKLRNFVSDLLKIEVRDNESSPWKVKLASKKASSYVSCGKLPDTPKLFGVYSSITPSELEIYIGGDSAKERTFYYRDVIACRSTNPVRTGKCCTVDLHIDKPCVALFWKAQSVSSQRNHNYSNYSTDPLEEENGWECIKSVRMTGDVGFDSLGGHHFRGVQARKHFPSIPKRTGFLAKSFVSRVHLSGPDASVNIQPGSQLLCKLDVCDITKGSTIFDDSETREDRCNQSDDELQTSTGNTNAPTQATAADHTELYDVEVRALVIREMIVTREEGQKIFKITLN